MGLSRDDRRIRAQRQPKDPVDPWHRPATLIEEERTPGGAARTLTLFLIGRECPFTCVYCDLWRRTTNRPTPRGAIPAQIRAGLAGLEGPLPSHIKLYNASNFFDPRAVPPADEERVIELLGAFERVVVECHPRLVGGRCLRFAAALGPGRLEVAMGLETIHPDALPRLNKNMSVADFDRAIKILRQGDIAVRTFVLVGTPFVEAEAQQTWTVRSVRHAADRGAERVSMIPVRGGNGEMERLEKNGVWRPPTLGLVESCLDEALSVVNDCIAQVDLWDLEALATCCHCVGTRLERLRRMNMSGIREAAIVCGRCASRSDDQHGLTTGAPLAVEHEPDIDPERYER